MSSETSSGQARRIHPFVVVVEARPEHHPAFRDLNLQWIDAHFRREPKDVALLDDPQAEVLDRGGQIFVAIHDHDPIGVCAMIPFEGDGSTPGDGSSNPVYELIKMAVRPESRGLGAGRALMHAAETWAKRQRARRIVIVTNSSLAPAVRLYESHGYRTVHSGPHPSYERADLIFEKDLEP